jgi:pullulanase
MTSWDKIKECCKEDAKPVQVMKHKMLIAATLLAQGIPFIHSGQEFCRTKFKLHNTYEASDEINKLDYVRRNQYLDVLGSTKDLIQIRKAHPCLRYSEKEDVEKYVRFDTIQNKALIYFAEDENEELAMIFNPSYESFTYQPAHLSTLIYDNQAVDACKVSHVDIRPHSVVILKYDKKVRAVSSDIKVEIVSEVTK